MRRWLESLIAVLGCFALLLAVPTVAAAEGPAAISVSPTSGLPGTSITVRGTNWTHPSWASGVPVNIYQNYGNGNLKRLADGNSGRPDAQGNFSIQMVVPSSAEAGLVTVAALTGGGSSTDAQFTVVGGSPTASSAKLAVDRAFTTDGTTTERATFKPGDAIWYVVSMNVENGPAKATVHWQARGPREIYNYTSREAMINSGYQAPYAPSTIPDDAPSGSYTLIVRVTVSGQTNVRRSTFTVNGSTKSGNAPSLAAQVAELTGMFWKVVETSNTVCDLLECKTIPPDVGRSISAISHVAAVYELGKANQQAVVVGNDLAALSRETKGHVRGAPLSTKARTLANKTWNDTRELHLTLVNLVPGLAQFFPVPPPR